MPATVRSILTKLRLLIAVIGMMQLAMLASPSLDGLRLVDGASSQASEHHLQPHLPAHLAVLATKLTIEAVAKSSTGPDLGLTGDSFRFDQPFMSPLRLATYAAENLRAQGGHHQPRVRGPPAANHILNAAGSRT